MARPVRTCTYHVHIRTNMYGHVLFASWCTYLVRIMCIYKYNSEYVRTSTYLYVFCTYIRTWIRTDTFILEQKIFVSADDLGRKSWDRCIQSQRLDWNLDCGFIQGTQWRQNKKGKSPCQSLHWSAAEGGKGLADCLPAVYGWAGLLHWKERCASFSFSEGRTL